MEPGASKHHDVVVGLAALAHPLRLQIVRALAVAADRGLTPGVIEDALQLPPATLSFHLRRLTAAGLVSADRSGRFVIYRATVDRMQQVVDFLVEQCGAGAAAKTASAIDRSS